MSTSDNARPRRSDGPGRRVQASSAEVRASARERIRAAAAALDERQSKATGAAVHEQERPDRRTAHTTARPTGIPRRPADENTSSTGAATWGAAAGTAPTSPAAPLPPPSPATGPRWSSGEWRAAIPTASPQPLVASREPKRRRRLAAVLSSLSITIGGGGAWLAIGGSSGDGGQSAGAVVREAEGHPSAPFGRGAPPFKQSGIGLVSVSPFGYEWTDHGSLNLEMWVYNAERFSAVLDCEVAVSTPERLVAQGTFPSIEGRVPPGVRRPVLLTFAASDTPGKFADLSDSSIDTRCRWSSR